MKTQSPSQIGDYIPVRTLGSGATGKVKLARHVRTGYPVALKIIRKHLLDTKQVMYQKVHREIAVMKLVAGNCRHLDRLPVEPSSQPHKPVKSTIGVLNLLDVYDTDHHVVLVLDYCEGGELFDVLVEHGHFPEAKVLDYFQQLVYALEFCHNRGVCHRDLKPENILLKSDGRVKLADFGMSSLLTPGSLLETSCGSPQYCAPEVILGEPYEGRSADVWSLGVVLFAMTTGGLPFDDDNLQRLISKIQSGAFYMPAEVPDDLAEVIRSMLVVEPSKRATIKQVKESPWFRSRPCRPDIYRDEHFKLRELLSSRAEAPVTDPDPTVLRYLADLGLGDHPTIRLRLAAEGRCKERDFYHQLAEFCHDSLSFRPVENVPMSPTKHSPATSPTAIHDIAIPAISEPLTPQRFEKAADHRQMTRSHTKDEPQAIAHRRANPIPAAIVAADLSASVGQNVMVTMGQSWFPRWAMTLASEHTAGPVTASAVQAQRQPLSGVSSR